MKLFIYPSMDRNIIITMVYMVIYSYTITSRCAAEPESIPTVRDEKSNHRVSRNKNMDVPSHYDTSAQSIPLQLQSE